MLQIHEKIRQARLSANLTEDEIAEKLGVSRSTYQYWEKKTPKIDKIIAVSKVLNLPEDYFFSKNDENSESFIDKRRISKASSKQNLVPFIPIKAQAGYVRAMDQEMYLDNLEKYALPPGVDSHGAIWRYWEIEGDSMEPVFHEKDIILTSFVHHMDWENLRNFYTYVIVTTERVLIKRIYCKNQMEWVLISENEDQHPQQLISVEDIKEVWVYRKTWSTRAAPSKVFEIKV